jgi:hypothetical protein
MRAEAGSTNNTPSPDGKTTASGLFEYLNQAKNFENVKTIIFSNKKDEIGEIAGKIQNYLENIVKSVILSS